MTVPTVEASVGAFNSPQDILSPSKKMSRVNSPGISVAELLQQMPVLLSASRFETISFHHLCQLLDTIGLSHYSGTLYNNLYMFL